MLPQDHEFPRPGEATPCTVSGLQVETGEDPDTDFAVVVADRLATWQHLEIPAVEPNLEGGRKSMETRRSAEIKALDGLARISLDGSWRLVESRPIRDTDGPLLAKLSEIPINVRGRAEAWTICRSQLQLTSALGKGASSVVYRLGPPSPFSFE